MSDKVGGDSMECPNCGSERVYAISSRCKFIPRFTEVSFTVYTLECLDCGATWEVSEPDY